MLRGIEDSTQTKLMSEKKPSDTPRGTETANYQLFRHGRWETATGSVIEESFVCVFVNGQEVVAMMAAGP